MAQVHIEIVDHGHEGFERQALKEGITLSEWMRAAAHRYLVDCERTQLKREDVQPFHASEEVEAFFRYSDTLEGSEREPNWEYC